MKLPAGASSGDQLTIRWPTHEQSQISTSSDSSNGGKRKAANEVANGKSPKRSRSDIGPSKEDSDLLVKITLPSKLKAKMMSSRGHIKVFAPWVTADRAADNTLTTRQLRSIGIDGTDGCNANLHRSRRKQIHNHGEGSFSVGHSRIGERYQVSNACIPLSNTWEKEHLVVQQMCERIFCVYHVAITKTKSIVEYCMYTCALSSKSRLTSHLDIFVELRIEGRTLYMFCFEKNMPEEMY